MSAGRRARWLALGLAGLALVLAANTGARALGWIGTGGSVEARAARLAPHLRVVAPEGAGPHPVALMAGGCDGPMDNLDRWAERLAAAGWASVVVDSHGPRGLRRLALWRLVCAGQLLQAPERAADLRAALHAVAGAGIADPGRVLLFGSSHGGWTVMEMLRDPAPPGIVAAIVTYPYCGRLNRTRRAGLAAPVPVLMILSERDGIAPTEACLAIAAAAAARGLPVEVAVIPGAGHGFDQAVRSPLSPLVFDPEATAAALAAGSAFLARIAAE